MNNLNDPLDSELDRARETLGSLAQHVDTAAAWTAVSAAVERAPRARALRRAQLAAVMVTVAAIVGAAVYARQSGPRKSGTAHPTRRATAPPECALPRLPAPGTVHSDLGLDLAGPAVSSLRGGAAQAPFELGGGEVTVSPPRPGDRPLVSAEQAECAALATSNANGWPLLRFASSYGGAAVGYARVSVSPELVAAAGNPAANEGQTDRNTHPKMPKATPYRERLAWIVVVRDVQFFSGPGTPSRSGNTTSTTAAPSPPSHDYDVFIVDAKTGTDALLYSEAQTPGGVGSVIVPIERVSVPWTLVSRSPNGYSGQIAATALPCDGVPNPVNVDRFGAGVSVVVERPVGGACGTPRQVMIALHAAIVTFNLPARIEHDPLGPDVAAPMAAPPPGSPYTSKCTGAPVIECVYNGPESTGGVLRTVTQEENGTTIDVKRGSVLSVDPLHQGKQYAALPVTSSDSAVLGVLLADEIHSFRAWRTGHADLVVPTNTCDPSTGKGMPCTPPWIVHVNIH
jgi:hypothetical protein